MKRPNVPLRMIFYIVSSCIILHNICIVMKDGFDNGSVAKIEDKLWKKITKGTIRAKGGLHGERALMEELQRRLTIMEKEDATNLHNIFLFRTNGTEFFHFSILCKWKRRNFSHF